jgi:hypothetical protein
VEQGKKKKKTVPKDDDTEEEEEKEVKKPVESKKKSKKAKNAEAEEEALDAQSPAGNPPGSTEVDDSAKKGSSTSSPFQRVKAEEVTYLKVKGGKTEAQRLKDNTFESKVRPPRPARMHTLKTVLYARVTEPAVTSIDHVLS